MRKAKRWRKHGNQKLIYVPNRSFTAYATAEAARCAGEQNKFWQYHDALLAMDRSKADEAAFRTTAQNLGLDVKSFTSCLATGKFKAAVEQDIQAGSQAGVVGTPGFFINGEFVSGAQPEAAFAKIIDSELTRMASKVQWLGPATAICTRLSRSYCPSCARATRKGVSEIWMRPV